MNTAQWPLELVFIAPFAVMFVAVWGTRRGNHRFLAAFGAAISMVLGGALLVSGVDASCAINESECIGATATAYLIGLIWLIAFVVSVVLISRAKAVNNLRSEFRN
ncbi:MULTISPECIES: hypothetical protein [unclassified Mesorhizobium]|jgi:hypothetical protein|uniref:hypothetical protein n=1 Tax=unclassified Mesorhizobium TaxID=325217 RepID=UPI0008F01FEF|nr:MULTISPECIES: hypothetical protein [unclassified Mesorhizobium]RJG43427.1 hypothetical protein D3Y55_03505 [Mesorhizobium sp. DCY119]SFT38942.1 hypothetical protein SAMN05518861_10122 [Mesorhizobium sp. YR577]